MTTSRITKIGMLLALMLIGGNELSAQGKTLMNKKLAATEPVPSLVNYDQYEELVKVVKAHRAKRMLSLDAFNKMIRQPDVILLDTRSKEMYDRKHIIGAIHLNFSDFTQDNLAKIIPNPNTKVVIYCNNNIDDAPEVFASKVFIPVDKSAEQKRLTLALNIPTYINLYGYGYENIYELAELISAFDNRLSFEGTDVKK